MAGVAYGSLPFREQIAFLLGKVSVPTRGWTDVWRDQHDSAFMVAGSYKADLLADLRNAVQRAMIDGTPLTKFKKDFMSIADKHGWSYNGTPSWRSRVIYETNLSTSYAAGRWAQLTDPDLLSVRPYWVYHHRPGELHPRPEHVAKNGLAVRADNPWWKSWYPPNGWGCQCWVSAESESSLARKNLKPSQPPPIDYETKIVGQNRPQGPRVVRVPKGIDPGFDYAPGATQAERIRAELKRSATRLPSDLKVMLQTTLDATPPPAPAAPQPLTPLPTPQTLGDFLTEGKKLFDRFAPGGKTDVTTFQTRVLAALREVRSVDAPMTVPGHGEAARRLRRVSRWIPDDWTAASDRAGPLTAQLVKNRSAYLPRPDGSGRFRLRKSAGNDITLHELMHRIQYVKPELDKLFQELHKRRTAGEALSDAERRGEFARKDHYVYWYQGREYHFGNANGNALEVITMAFEYVLGGDTKKLRLILSRDPEMVRLVLSALWHAH